jgi:hypothetical protein
MFYGEQTVEYVEVYVFFVVITLLLQKKICDDGAAELCVCVCVCKQSLHSSR